MLYFCVKTDEYLRSILDIVSRGSRFYKTLDVSEDVAQKIVAKMTARYSADLPRHKRSYALNHQSCAVFDIVVLQNQSMSKVKSVRFCILATLPKSKAEINAAEASTFIFKTIGLGYEKADFERFYCVDDRKTRLCYMSTSDKKSYAIYELLQMPYTAEEMQKKGIKKTVAWTWRLHKDFVKIKTNSIESAFKDAQRRKDKQLPTVELNILWAMAGFRGVRDDIFKINQKLFGLSHRYLNKPLELELLIPRYTIKQKRLAATFDEMVSFKRLV